MLTQREELAKKFMEEQFVPTIRDFFKLKAPSKYKLWGGNCCRQIAIFGAYFLSKSLTDYRFTVWDGNFEDMMEGRKVVYNHAWIYAVSKDKQRKLFIDMGRSLQENIFVEQSRNAYDNNLPGYNYIKELERTQLDWETMLATEIEYYTGIQSMELAKILESKFKQ
jgi:hypothetical protein